jgi:hypothetical protein
MEPGSRGGAEPLNAWNGYPRQDRSPGQCNKSPAERSFLKAEKSQSWEPVEQQSRFSRDTPDIPAPAATAPTL